MTIVRSGKCVPPEKGSFSSAMSPACNGKAARAAATEAGWPLLVILGEPAFYARFGFEPAEPLGLSYAPVGAGDPHFQARRLPGYSAAQRGVFSYCWEY